MRAPTYITTSWDDGHPLDLRVAELLAKHRLSGTFYVPMSAVHGTMAAPQIRELSGSFEIGAHTLDHLTLSRANEDQAWRQIAGSKRWLEDSTGLPCPMFCPPEGKYSNRHLQMIQEAGYIGLRSVELASLACPRRKAGLMLMPTSVQAHPHDPLVFYRNAFKRAAFGNLWRYIVCGRSNDWPGLACALLRRVIRNGGVFHLWGHSWELQQTGQWQRLDEVLRMMSQFERRAALLTNGQICRSVSESHRAAPHFRRSLSGRG